MELSIQGGKSVEVSDAIFGRDFSEALVHQVVTAYLAGGACWNQSTEEPRCGFRRRPQAVASEGNW